MITTLLLTFIFSILTWLLSWLPSVTTMPTEYSLYIQPLFTGVSVIMNIPILRAIPPVFVFMGVVYFAWFLVWSSNWLYNKIRGSG